MDLTSDLLAGVFSHLSLQESYRLSQVTQATAIGFKDYRRQRGYTRTQVGRMRRAWTTWVSLRKLPPKPIINSWTKRPKDPETPILLF
jgi:hypothetical protein